MKNEPVRVLTENILRRSLEEIRRDPERSVRNLVDLALLAAKGRFQTQTLKLLQEMLRNPHSYYYSLIRDTALHVTPDRLLGFGLNLGYNGCTRGAEQIRRIEASEGFNVPWTLWLELGGDADFESVVTQGEQMGIRVWQLFCGGRPGDGLTLAETHPESAFVLYCRPEDLDLTILDWAGALNNLLLLIEWVPGCQDACDLLRQAELLYGIWSRYGAADLGQITTGSLLVEASICHPTAVVLVPGEDCDDEIGRVAHQYIMDARQRQLFPALVLEGVRDSGLVDGIISEEDCTAAFDRFGRLQTLAGTGPCVFGQDLRSVLKHAFPVKQK